MAAHSVLVSRLCPTLETKAWALLHDAEEAFTCDMPSGLKAYLASDKYRELQSAVSEQVIATFLTPKGIVVSDEVKSFVKMMDDMVNRMEYQYFMGNGTISKGFADTKYFLECSKTEKDHAENARHMFDFYAKEYGIL